MDGWLLVFTVSHGRWRFKEVDCFRQRTPFSRTEGSDIKWRCTGDRAYFVDANADTGRIDVEAIREASMTTVPVVARAKVREGPACLLGPFFGWKLIGLRPSRRWLVNKTR